MKRFVIRMGDLTAPQKHPLTFALWREVLEWLKTR
jgi:hypothetical protein